MTSSSASPVPCADVIHGTFTVAREFDASPAQVFAAYADPIRRRRWFRIPGPPEAAHHELDFRVGGHESAGGAFAPAGTIEHIEYNSRFIDICPDRRIVLTYDLTLDGQRRWASLVVIELECVGGATRLRHTEQYALLVYEGDGRQDTAHLEGGTRLQLNGLAAAVQAIA